MTSFEVINFSGLKEVFVEIEERRGEERRGVGLGGI
jgi:hypothetical protein